MSPVKNFLALAFYFVVLDGLAISCIVWAVISFGRDEYLTVVVVLGIAVMCIGLTSSLVLVMCRKVSPRAELRDQGISIRPDRVVDDLIKVGIVGGYIATALYAIFTPLGKIDIPQPPGNHQYVVVVAAGGAIWGIFDLWRTFKRGGVSFVRLTPTGFEMSQGSSSMNGVWDDVSAITDRRPEKSPPFRAMIFVKFRDDRIRSLVVDSYTPGGDAMRQLVRYYWLNADKRDELTNGRAIERLAEFGGKA
jgi:hypothetical protein